MFIRNNITDDFYQLLSALSNAEKVVEEDHDKECNNKINRIICHYFLPPCGNSTHFEPPTSVCSGVCEQVSKDCSYQWRIFRNKLINENFDPMTCDDTGKIIHPLPYSCSNIGVNSCKL